MSVCLVQSLKEKKCCDVFNKRKKKAVGSHAIKLELARHFKEKGISVKPGETLCRNCYEMVINEQEEMEDDLTNPVEIEEEPQPSDNEDFEVSKKEELETSFELAGVSPTVAYLGGAMRPWPPPSECPKKFLRLSTWSPVSAPKDKITTKMELSFS